ncbi:MAG: histidine kinase dimerization/phospho-acceptor domain-containing protein [Thermodesulfobacteriota bacterium]
MSLRVVVATLLLVITVLIQYQSRPAGVFGTLSPLYVFIASVYLLTIVYGILLGVTRDPGRVIFVQMILDPLLVTALIYVTGGISSPFTFLYLLVIMVASRLLYRRGGVIAASLSSILYAALLDFQYLGYIVPLNFDPLDLAVISAGHVIYQASVHIVAFYFMAFLSSYWSEQARKDAIELDRRQRNIWELEAFNRNIVQSINTGLFTLDTHGRITSFNRAAEDITAFSHNEVIGQPLAAVFPYLNLSSEGDNTSGNNNLSSFQYKNREGRELCLSFLMSPLKNADHENIGQLILFQDMTEIKAMEEEIQRQQVLASIGKLTAAMAHEIRNPLASLSGCVQMLTQDRSSNRGKFINIILRDAERLDRLLSDFLLYARPEDSEAREVEVGQIVQEVAANLYDRAGRIGVQVLIDFKSPIYIKIAPEHLSRVIENLLIKILETGSDGGEIRIDGRLVQQTGGDVAVGDGNFLCLLVKYGGAGVFPHHTDSIFSPFPMIEGGVDELGLAVVYRLIEYYGGKICFKGPTKEDQGTICYIYLPVNPTQL